MPEKDRSEPDKTVSRDEQAKHFSDSLNLIIDSTKIGLWDWDLRTGEVIYSRQWEQIAGYEEGELPQHVSSWENALFPEDLEAANQKVADYVSGKSESYEAEFRMVRKDGSIIWAQDRGTIIECGKNGEPVRLLGILQDISAIKEAERILQEKTEQLDFIAKMSGLAAWDYDRRTGLINYNDDFLEMLEFTRAEVKGNLEEWEEMIHPDDSERAVRALREFLSGRTDSYSQEIRLRRKDGSYIWTLDTCRVVEWDRERRPLRIVGGLLNIDTLKRAEEKLQEALEENRRYNQRLRSEVQQAVSRLEESRQWNQVMFEANPYINFIMDEHCRVIDCNPAALAYFGYASKEDMVRQFPAFMRDSVPRPQEGREDSAALVDHFNYTIQYGYNEFETMIMIRGKPVPIKAVFKKILYHGAFAVAAYIVDLSSLKEARNELEYQDKLLQKINEAAAGLLAAGPENFDKVIVEALRQAGQSAGTDRVHIWENRSEKEELYCRRIYIWSGDTLPGEDRISAAEICFRDIPEWQSVLSGRRNINSPARKFSSAMLQALDIRETGSILVIPIFIQRAFWGFIAFEDTKAERHFTESEERILQSGGMVMVSGILRNNMTNYLIEAREEALASTRAKSEFLSRMSHEIRTPMNAIIGMTAIAKKSSDVSRIQYCLRQIDSASQQLLGIINDILDMSKIEANKLEIVMKPFDLEKMLQDTYDAVRIRAEKKRQRLTFSSDGSFKGSIISDEMRLSQIILILLSNAIKFTDDGGNIILKAGQVPGTDDSPVLHVEVIDDGIGISREQQEKLFVSFEQGDGGANRKFGGTGLGLAICKRIIGLMGGTIWVESKEGTGSRFIFEVPVQRGSEPGSGGQESSPGIWKGKHILVVEDIDINREIIGSILEDSGALIDYAEDGLEGLEKYSNPENKYDIILMDIQMPRLDGFAAARKIRELELPHGRQIPIIAMTANALKEDIQASLDAGMNGHVSKPINLDELMQTMGKYLS
ncbi:PAS domain-containing protein [Treponema sp. OttesenSCG-928-L16]|nr:PAS domain-containing protein [Treponema sp. OttesenSCG-928-L16]